MAKKKSLEAIARKHIVKVLVNEQELRIIDERRNGVVMSRGGFLRWMGLCAAPPSFEGKKGN